MVAMTPRNIMSGFCSTGNWPYNPQSFDETDLPLLLLLIMTLFKILGAVLQILKLFKVNWAINKPAILLWIGLLVIATMLQVMLIS